MWNPIDDVRRLYGAANEIKDTGNVNANVTRRDAIKMGGLFFAGGVADFGEDGDFDSYDSAANVLGGTADGIGEFVSVDVDPLGPFNNEKPGSSRERTTVGETGDQRDVSQGSTGINNYNRFEAGLRNQSPKSLEYLEGALERDPGDVDDVSFENEGLYVDAVVAYWDKMDRSMRSYLGKAEQSGDLDEWLSKYEKQNL